MANEDKKDFNKMMLEAKDMPKIVEIKDEKGIKKWGGKTLLIAPPIDYDKYMKVVPKGKLITTAEIRKRLAKDYGAEVTCPLTAGIFTNICAWASYQRKEDITPYWRTLKSDGELNEKYPGGVEKQSETLKDEGYTIRIKGAKNKRYFVEDYEKFLLKL